jgi:hypothetical protein
MRATVVEVHCGQSFPLSFRDRAHAAIAPEKRIPAKKTGTIRDCEKKDMEVMPGFGSTSLRTSGCTSKLDLSMRECPA